MLPFEAGLDNKRTGAHALRKAWGYQARKKGIIIEQIPEKLGYRSSIVIKDMLVLIRMRSIKLRMKFACRH